MGKLIIKLTLLCASVVLCFGLAEGLLRLFPSLVPLEIQQTIRAKPEDYGLPHPYLGNLHKPLSAGIIQSRDFKTVNRTDGHGFRNPWPWPKQAEIIVLGDSLAFGFGVEDNEAWPEILKQLLSNPSVINLGLIGSGLTQYLRVYQTFGVALHPKLVIVGLFLGNDLWDTLKFDQWLKSKDGDNYMAWRDSVSEHWSFNIREPVSSMKALLKGNSYCYNLLRVAYKDFQSRNDTRLFRFSDGSQIHLSPREFAEMTQGASPDRPEYRLALKALREICSIAEQNGTQVLFAMQPSKEEVYLPLLGQSVRDPGAALRPELDKWGVGYLDLTPAFREHAKAGQRLFFDMDGHPNREGYRLTAEEIATYLKEKMPKLSAGTARHE